MKRSTHRHAPVQQDFWPELRNKSMALYAALAAPRAPARSVSEDGRTGSAKPAGKAPLGIYGENAVTLTKKGRA